MYLPAFLLSAQNSCTLATININNWIGVDALIVLATLSVGAIIYSLSGLLPNPMRDRLKGAVRIEYTEGFFSIVLIASLVSMAYAACGAGAALSGLPSGDYQNIFQSDSYYITSLLFVKGTSITTQLIAQGMILSIDSAFSNNIFFSLSSSVGKITGSGILSKIPIKSVQFLSNYVIINYTGRISNVYSSYSNTYVVYSGFIVVTFGALFILYFLLPLISALALNLLVPVAILMRSISFAGPKLREASNALIALGVALFFVFPLTISVNQGIMNWLYCANGTTSCNPYTTYLGSYDLGNIPLAYLLTPQTANFGNAGGVPLTLPVSFYLATTASGSGGYGSYIMNLIEGLILLPNQVNNMTAEVAQYVFEGIVLIAIDFAITMGFAQGLYKGLNAIPSIMGNSGPFWGS
jgi:hypothetical protein